MAHDDDTIPTTVPPTATATTTVPPATLPPATTRPTTTVPPATVPPAVTPTTLPATNGTISLLLSGSESFDFSDISSVPSLPPPHRIHRGSVSPVKPRQPSLDSLTLEMEVQELQDRVASLDRGSISPVKPRQPSLDSLTLEMEVQELQDRVASLEENQRKILKNQDEIISRLVALEKRPHSYSTQYSSPFPDFNHHLPIPPPPSHPPPRFFQPPEDQTPSRELHPCHTHAIHGSAAPRRFILGDSFNHETVPYQNRAPFRSIQPGQPGHGDQTVRAEPLGDSFNHETIPYQNRAPFRSIQPSQPGPGVHAEPIRAKPGNVALPSSAIMKHPKLRFSSKIGTLAVKLARDAVFGDDVMAQCTVAGERGLPGLPTKELQQLKQALFVQFPVAPQEFEVLWKTSTAAVGQACKRLRSKNVPSLENM